MSSESNAKRNAETMPTKRPDRGGLLAWVVLGAVALVFLTYLKWRPLTIDANGVDHPAVGERLAFHELLPLTGGGEPKSAADLKGKVTLINIWGTWCPPCAEEFPYLAAIYDQFRSHPSFQYLSVSYDETQPAELRQATEEFLQRMRVDHPTYYDPGAATLRSLSAIGLGDAFPTTVIVDEQQNIRAVWRGFDRASMADIEAMLEKLLAE